MENNEMITLLKKQLLWQRITTLLLIIMLVGIGVCGIIVLPKIEALYTTTSQLIDEIQPTIDGLNNFDYATLNSTLTDLKSAIDSLNGVLSIFH